MSKQKTTSVKTKRIITNREEKKKNKTNNRFEEKRNTVEMKHQTREI